MGTHDKGDADITCIKEDSVCDERDVCREQMDQSQRTTHTDSELFRFLDAMTLTLRYSSRKCIYSALYLVQEPGGSTHQKSRAQCLSIFGGSTSSCTAINSSTSTSKIQRSTSRYKLRIQSLAERADQRHDDSSTVRMGINVIQRGLPTPRPISKLCESTTRMTQLALTSRTLEEPAVPTAAVKRRLLLTEGSIRLEARLDRAIYAHGDSISVHVYIANDSHRSVRRIEVLALQHVEVCMFNNGIFKNTVASVVDQANCPLVSGSTLTKTYNMQPTEGSPKHWIALEENYTRAGSSLASTVISSELSEKDRSPYYAINVSYYVQVKLLTSLMCEKISVKLPFTLIHKDPEADLMGFATAVRDIPVQTSRQENRDDEEGNKMEEIKKCDSTPDLELIKNIESKES
ncbi:arrestin, lateral eye-like isoform X2 [Diachasmimorpha longicaudata]|uniref:arrestin, lateral eye-like isoform X2 n=1 Tax=Diachasmimorpha longicaudata TaxID=58733 RepID=UPI0030B8E408